MYLGQADSTSFDASGNVYLDDGTIIAPDGTTALPDGTTIYPDGTVTDQTGGDATSSLMKWTDTLQKLLQVGVMTDAQRKLMQINLTRAQQGLQPISLESAGMGVNVGVSTKTSQMIYVLGFAALAVLLLGVLKK